MNKYWTSKWDLASDISYQNCKRKAIYEVDKIMKTYKNFGSLDDIREFTALAKVFQAINRL